MCKKRLLILGVCMAAIVVTSLFLWDWLSPQIPWKFEKSISRNFDNQEEERALAAVESINYSAIVSLERFDGSSDPEAYLHPGTYLSYTWANFIDSEVIGYYETRYDNMQGKIFPKQIELTYQANVQNRSEFRIFNSPPPEGAKWYNTTVFMSASNGSFIIKDPVHIQFYFRNESSYQMIERGYDFNFTDCYVVEMKLTYSEIYAPVAAFHSEVPNRGS